MITSELTHNFLNENMVNKLNKIITFLDKLEKIINIENKLEPS